MITFTLLQQGGPPDCLWKLSQVAEETSLPTVHLLDQQYSHFIVVVCFFLEPHRSLFQEDPERSPLLSRYKIGKLF